MTANSPTTETSPTPAVGTVGRAVAHCLQGCWRPDPPPLRDAVAFNQALPVLRRTGALALAWRRLEPTRQQETDEAAMRGAIRSLAAASLEYEHWLPRVLAAFHAAGIEAMVVKGWAVARHYPRGCRPYGDLDLCVDPARYTEARRVAASLPAAAPEVDLHPAYPKLYDRSWAQLRREARHLTLGDATVLVPGEEDHLRLLCMHMLHHGAWRPLWLCDVAAATEDLSPEFDWDACLHGSRNIGRIVRCGVSLAQEILGAESRHIPIGAPLPGWLSAALFAAWSEGTGATTLPPMGRVVRRGGWRSLSTAIQARWRNPIQATVELRVPFNNFPRWPLQVASLALRAPDFARQWWRSGSREKSGEQV